MYASLFKQAEVLCKMADVEDERYEDEETSDFAPEVGEPIADNHHSESEQPNASDDSQPELKQQSEDVDDAVDSEQRSDADPPSAELHPPGETPESTEHDQNTAPIEVMVTEVTDKSSTSNDGDDERLTQTGMSNPLDRYN